MFLFMMSMQGPRSLSNACTSITALLKRGARENEFSTPIIQSHFPHPNLFSHIPVHLREPDWGRLGAGEGWVCLCEGSRTLSSVCDFAEPDSTYSICPDGAPDTCLWDCPSQAILIQCSAVFTQGVHPPISSWSHRPFKPRCVWELVKWVEAFWEKKKYRMLGKKVFMQEEFIFLT